MQDKRRVNLYASLGVAVREMDIDAGSADYMLFVDDKACEVIEAKREGYNLGDVIQQSHRYAVSATKFVQRWSENLLFAYEAISLEIRFCDRRDSYARSRNRKSAVCQAFSR
jgi:type I restriction enzyme, R subunit